MLYIIFGIDRPNSAETRQRVMQAHRDYLATEPIKVVMSGPLVSDDGASVVGSLYMVEAESRAEIEKFQAGDPLVAADIWQTVEIRAFDKRLG